MWYGYVVSGQVVCSAAAFYLTCTRQKRWAALILQRWAGRKSIQGAGLSAATC